MLAADTCMLLISYCKQMMIDFRVLDRAQVLEIIIQGVLDYRDNYVEKSSQILKSPQFWYYYPENDNRNPDNGGISTMDGILYQSQY